MDGHVSFPTIFDPNYCILIYLNILNKERKYWMSEK